jgi:hypothetical protein
MDERPRWRRSPLRSFAFGATVGAAGTIAALRSVRRGRAAGAAHGLAAFEDAPCFRELVRAEQHGVRDAPPPPD